MPHQDYRKLTKTKLAVRVSLIVALIAIAGIFSIVFINNTNNNPEISKAANLTASQDSADTAAAPKRVKAVNTSGNDQLVGLNARKASCSPDVVAVVDWGTEGTILNPEGKVDSCVGKTLTWYHIKWDNGTEGWSITDFLEFEEVNQ